MRFNSSILHRILFRIHGRVVHLRPEGIPQGTVLLSYTTLPFLDTRPEVLNGHTNRWECLAMARTFLARGYAVDVIDFENSHFVPAKKYSYMIDVGQNLERLSELLNKECVKIFHITTAHWSFNNMAENKRMKDLGARRGVTLLPERLLPENRSVEQADLLLLLGNDFTESTYAHIQKPMFRIPISTTFTYPSPEAKDFEHARTSFIWIGGAGPVHKGVDLLLEAFADMPEYHLHLCGKLTDPAFEQTYHRELYETPHITAHGMVDLGGTAFERLCSKSACVISPSCAEGQSGAVIVGMHAGLIPLISRESGIDTDSFGITMSNTTVDSIRAHVRTIADMDPDLLRTRAIQSWEYARSHHTRELFMKIFGSFVDELESRYPVVL